MIVVIRELKIRLPECIVRLSTRVQLTAVADSQSTLQANSAFHPFGVDRQGKNWRGVVGVEPPLENR